MSGWGVSLIWAWLWDRLLGDPRSDWHPVCLVGNLISKLEAAFRRPDLSPTALLWRGGIVSILVLIIVTVVALCVQWAIFRLCMRLELPVWVGMILQGLMISFTISARSLKEAGIEIADLLARNDMVTARQKVAWIVGRDTLQMDEGEATRATVETIAENITDGIIAPLFYGAIGGLAGAWFYRATNTLDSMIGYKNEKYLYFGRMAAYWDDVMNYLPGRLTGVLLILSGYLVGKSGLQGVRFWRRDAASHPSPNSGIPESMVAGILGIQLGGKNFYGGISSFRAHMGDPVEPLQGKHILETIRLMEVTSLLGVLLLAGCSWMFYG